MKTSSEPRMLGEEYMMHAMYFGEICKWCGERIFRACPESTGWYHERFRLCFMAAEPENNYLCPKL